MPNLIDEQTLASLRELQSEEDPHFLRNYFCLFLKPIPSLTTRIRNAVESSNYEELEMSAHALKSSSSNSGIEVVTALCAELEKLGQIKSVQGAKEKCLELEKHLADLELEVRLLPEFKAHLGQ